MDTSEKEKKRKRTRPLLILYRRVTQACDTYDNVMEWYDLVTEVRNELEYIDVIPLESLNVSLDKSSNLIDTSRFGIEQACNILRKDFKSALEGFLEEGLENIPEKYFEKSLQTTQSNAPINDAMSATGMKMGLTAQYALVGGIGGTAAVMATVLALLVPFDFSISIDNEEFAVLLGEQMQIPITIHLENGDSKDVHLSCSVNPPGPRCSFDNSIVRPPTGSINVIVDTQYGVDPGIYTLYVRGDGDNKIKSNDVVFVVSDLPQLQIVAFEPKNHAKITASPVETTVQIRNESPVENASVEFTLDGKLFDTVKSNSSGYASTQFSKILYGEHFWSAKAEKEKFKTAQLDDYLFVFLDAGLPIIQISSHVSGQTIRTSSPVIHGVSSDPGCSGITRVEVSVNNGPFVPASGTVSWTFVPTLPDGPNKIAVRAFDKASNYNDDTISIMVDTNVYATGMVSLDRISYPIPFGSVDDFQDIDGHVPNGRSLFPLHQTAMQEENLEKTETIQNGELTVYVRIDDADLNVSPQKDWLAKEVGDLVGPVKISVLRGSEKIVLAFAGGDTPNPSGLIDVNDNNSGKARQLGPIQEQSPNSGIFEMELTILYTDGPSSLTCPSTISFLSPDNSNIRTNNEMSRFDEPSAENANYCILQGDILQVEYFDENITSGNSAVISDTAVFELHEANLQSDNLSYIIGRDIRLTLVEPDFNLDSKSSETYSLDLIEWDSDAATLTMGNAGGETAAFDPEPSALRETGDNTGIFQILVEMPEMLYGDNLERGEEIILEYTDWGPSGSSFVGEQDRDMNQTIFTSNFGATIELDQKVYTWTDRVLITILAPDHNFDENLIDDIGNTDFDPVKVSTRGFDIDNYMLVETDVNSGIFQGVVTLAPASDGTFTAGTGPTDGVLETGFDDGITVSFEFSEDETVVGSALIYVPTS